mmetsp:Transcript_29291/g.75493  ORF Transcript_29291/g.75493 Transcript_29291/m.75493 type:complete len:160 (+) Transcript_29291:186-665(+)
MNLGFFTTGLDEKKKIGIGLCASGAVLTFLGMLLFFDGGLLAIGNLLFISGFPLLIGVSRTLSFFSKRDKLPGTICFFLGIVLVFARWPRIGILVEGFGIINLFGNFFPIVLAFARRLPYISKVLEHPLVRKLEEKLRRRKGEEADNSAPFFTGLSNIV